jgi:FeS assembly SUF system regulator
VLRISKLTDYGTVILAHLASAPDRLHAAAEVAEQTRLSLPTVSKLLKTLQRAGLVTSTRGSHGGYQLTRPPTAISAVAILDALEGGPVAITECSGKDSHCGIEHVCRVGRAWQRVNLAIRRTLSDINLAQLAGIEAGPIRTLEASLDFRGTRSPPRLDR